MNISVWILAISDYSLRSCPWVPKNTIFDLVRSIAFLVLIGSLWDLQVIWTGIKSGTNSNSGQIGLWSYLPVRAKIKPIFDLVRSIACFVSVQTLWNLQITWTGIKSRTSSNSGQIKPLTLELLALYCLKLSYDFSIYFFCPEHSMFSFDWIFMKIADNLDSRATENRFFAGPDRFLVCKTDSVCIKRFFFSVRKNTLCGSYTGPITWISQVSNS